MKKIKKIIISVFILNILNSVYLSEKLFVVDLPNEKWLPNTVLLDGLPVILYKDYWYLCCQGGLIQFNRLTGKFSVYSLPNLKSEYPGISGLAQVNNTLWVSTQQDGIFVFDLGLQFFAKSFLMAKGTGFGEGSNLEITQDFDNEKVWVSSFEHLDVFDLKTKEWQNLDSVFSGTGMGKPSSSHFFLPDDNLVWISDQSGPTKGMIKFELEKNKSFPIFFKILTGSARDGFSTIQLISSPKFLWVYFIQDNGYNFYLNVYDKQNNIWKSYHREKIISAIELLITEIPNIKWVGKNFLVEFLSFVNENNLLEEDQPYKFQPKELELLSLALKKLEETYNIQGIDYKFVNYGLYNYCLQGSTIYAKENRWGKEKPIYNLNLNFVKFKRLIGFMENYVVLETDKGIALFDPGEYTLKYLEPLTKLNGNKLGILWLENRGKAVVFEWYGGMDCEAEYYKLLDFESLKITELQISDELKLKVYEPLLQKKVLLPNKEIILRWDGLLIKNLK